MDLEIKWPRLTIGGKGKVVECKETYNVDLAGEIKLELNPLIEANFTLDILNILLRVGGDAAGGYGHLLVKIKEAAAQGVNNESFGGKAVVGIDFTVGGDIKGDLVWTKVVGQDWDNQGSISAAIGFKAEGKVYVEGRIFLVTVSAGISISAKGSEGGENKSEIRGVWIPIQGKNGPGVQGQLKFSGLSVFYTRFAKIGIDTIDDEKKTTTTKQPTQRSAGAMAPPRKVEGEDITEKKIWELLPPTEWPKGKETNSPTNGKKDVVTDINKLL